MDDLIVKIKVFRKRIVDMLIEYAPDITWTFEDNKYNTIINGNSIYVTPKNITIIDDNHNLYNINTDSKLYDIIKNNKQVLCLNDIVVRISYKEMKSLDIDIEPIDAYIKVGNHNKRFRLYYNHDDDVYFGYTRDLEFEDIPHCKVIGYKDYLKHQYISDYELRPQSILYSYGYKVTGTTDEQRHKALQFVIDQKIMGWREIIEFLEWLISMRNNEQNCVEIWHSDIDWIRKYVKGDIKKVRVK